MSSEHGSGFLTTPLHVLCTWDYFLFGLVWLFFDFQVFCLCIFVFLLPQVYLPSPNDALIVNPNCYTHYPFVLLPSNP